MGEITETVKEIKEQKEQAKKLSYEELAKVASEIQQQGQKLFQENQQLKAQLNNQGPIIRMNFLFEILKNDKYFKSDDCIKCAEEIMESLYPTMIEEDIPVKEVEESPEK